VFRGGGVAPREFGIHGGRPQFAQGVRRFADVTARASRQQRAPETKVFLLLFLQKKKNSCLA
jgi:hypothetical protein